jgi:hypothetical protein
MATTPEAFFDIQDKNKRDLLWSIFGPSLLSSSVTPPLTEILPELCESRLKGTTLSPDFQSPRLGFRFEQLWQSALSSSEIPFIANQQITDEGRTLGELDLLIPRGQSTLHIELALKFYLGVEDDWIGPNRRDLLSRKIQHTFDHQLPLAQNPVALSEIKQLAPAPVQSFAIMRGCLFAPAHDVSAAPLPVEISPDHWSGYWCPIEQAHYLPEGHWYVLSKQDWLSPVFSSFAITRDELLKYLTRAYQYLSIPLAIARMEKLQNGWGETERWMMVAPDWHS